MPTACRLGSRRHSRFGNLRYGSRRSPDWCRCPVAPSRASRSKSDCQPVGLPAQHSHVFQAFLLVRRVADRSVRSFRSRPGHPAPISLRPRQGRRRAVEVLLHDAARTPVTGPTSPCRRNWEHARLRHVELHERRDQCAADERGLYECEFTVPANWSRQRVFLVFEGVMTDTSAKLNGESVGPTHQGSFYRFKYEVTQLAEIRRDEQTGGRQWTNIRPTSRSTAPSATADYWVFGGILPAGLSRSRAAAIHRTRGD